MSKRASPGFHMGRIERALIIKRRNGPEWTDSLSERKDWFEDIYSW